MASLPILGNVAGFLGGAAGAIIPAVQDAALAVAVVESLVVQSGNPQATSSAPYRPSIWQEPALTSITVTALGSASNIGEVGSIYVPDAVLMLTHNTELTVTQNPVLSGANIADHAYVLPQTVTVEIGMSDAMDEYGVGMWSMAGSKSVNAYKLLKALALGRATLTLQTRLDTYTNMIIQNIIAPDDVETRWALRATVTFFQLLTASVASFSIPNTPDAANLQTSSIGTVVPQQPTGNLIPSHLPLDPRFLTTLPQGGQLSSVAGVSP